MGAASGWLAVWSRIPSRGSRAQPSANFQIANEGQVLDASYEGVVPDLFFNLESEIVLEGKYSPASRFHVDNVVVKCPSKYEALSEEV